jgi:hypothetical protein
VASEQLFLKPGDLVVALRLVLCPGDRYESLAEALGMSLSVAQCGRISKARNAARYSSLFTLALPKWRSGIIGFTDCWR